jgi:hypothetical protein
VPPRIDLEPYKDDITNMVCSGESNEAILDTLANDYGITVSHHTLFYRLVEWGLKGIRRSAQDAAVLNRHVLPNAPFLG